jgi:AcrR family transcriptional regulator
MAAQHLRPAKPARFRLTRTEWIVAARTSLIEGGMAAVKVERLALALGVTIGSFYWHFANRADLLAALIADWKATNTASMIEAATNAEGTAEDRFDAFIDVWIKEGGYSPEYDSAVRDWARYSANVRAAVREVDLQRIGLLRTIFSDLGYDDDRAEVRARIAYFHQVGFYALGLRDDETTRLKLRSLYIEALRDGPGRHAQ